MGGSRVLGYLRDCLARERSRDGVINLFGGKVLRRAVLKGEEVAVRDDFVAVEIDPEVGQYLVRMAGLRSRDAELWYGTLMLCGRFKGRRVVCPLLLYPLREVDGVLFPVLEEVKVNEVLFDELGVPSEVEGEIEDLVSGGRLSLVTPDLVAKALGEFFEELDVSGLVEYPKLVVSGVLYGAGGEPGWKLFSGAALMLVQKSKNVAGLLKELDVLKKMKVSELSNPLRIYLGESEWLDGEDSEREFLVPAILSEPQVRLLSSVARNDLTVCEGPPGTGKSFSLAAAALDEVALGRSVLICCRSNEAAKVLEGKLEELMGGVSELVVRAGRGRLLKDFKTRLAELDGWWTGKWMEMDYEEVNRERKELMGKLMEWEEKLQGLIDEAMRVGRWFWSGDESWWLEIRKWFHLKRLRRRVLLAEVFDVFAELHEQRVDLARRYHGAWQRRRRKRAWESVATRKTVRSYRKVLSARYSSAQEERLKRLNPELLFEFFPVWITTTDDVHRVLPLDKGLFDVVMMDEATQCDLGSAAPVLFRGRRALVAGDRNQLRHLSFLSNEGCVGLAKKWGLTEEEAESFQYRQCSLIERCGELLEGEGGFVRLNEHFRSLPSLIRFSNEEFYRGSLRVMRDSEGVLGLGEGALELLQVDGFCDQEGVNEAELEVGLEICRKVLRDDRNETIGFLSPFRAQVDAFLEALEEKFDPCEIDRLLKRHQLLVGTAHSFQGAERDGMILSFVVTGKCSAGKLRFLERADVFNVSVTRARNWMKVCHSVRGDELNRGSLLRRYLRMSGGGVSDAKGNEIECDLIEELKKKGWSRVLRGELTGVEVDLIFEKSGQLVVIDMIGMRGDVGQSMRLGDLLGLRRGGVRVVLLRMDEWEERRDEFLEYLDSK